MLLLVLEPQPELSAAVAAELRSAVSADNRQMLPLTPSPIHFASAGTGLSERRPGTHSSCHPDMEIESVSTTQRAMQRMQNVPVAGVVLDLNHLARESLVLLRHMQLLARRPEILAVGSEPHYELMALLLDAGCSTLLTQLPYDIPTAVWVRRVMAARLTAATI